MRFPTLLLLCAACALFQSVASAQPPGRPGAARDASRPQEGRRQPGPGERRPLSSGMQQGQQPPWIAIFDTDNDGELSETEIENATASLRKLDRNNDGKIAGGELRFGGETGRPPRMGQQRGTPGGPPSADRGRSGPSRDRQPQTGGRGPRSGTQSGDRERPVDGNRRGGDPAQADEAFAAEIMSLDANNDHLITMAELPDHMHEAFGIADADRNGFLTEKELLVLASQFRRNQLSPAGDQPVNAPTQGRPDTDRRQDRGAAGTGPRQRGEGQAFRSGQRERPRDKVRPRDLEFQKKVPLGSTLPDTLRLYDVDRRLVAANSIFQAEYTVIVGGCLTCPEFRNSYPEIEAVARDYRGQGVQFYFLYQSLTHPENWDFVQPTSLQERFAQVEHARELLQTKIPWLTDTMDNEMKQHFAMTPNSQFVFDRDGHIVHRDSWGRGSSLRESLEKLVGPSKQVTTVSELSLPQFGRHKTSPDEMLVQRKRVDGVAVPLRVSAEGEELNIENILSPDFADSNRYAKLRPEASQDLIQTGTGQLYLGFRQDPVLGAAWNNLATPLKYRIIADGVTTMPTTAEAPKLDVDSDTDPREFLVEVKNWKKGEPLKVQIQYFACSKTQGWCKPVQQDFTVWLEQDRTAGMVNGRTHFPGGGSQSDNAGGRRSRGGGLERIGR